MAVRGPYAKTAARRAEILDAALAIIAGTGWSGATLQQVADAVGMSKPGLLHHFGSRDALFAAVLARRDELDTAAMDEVDTATEGDDAEGDRLDGLVAVVRHNQTVPGLVALYSAVSGTGASESPGSPSRDFLDRRYPDVVGMFAEAVRRRQAEGGIPAEHDPDQLARLLVAAADGLQTQWLLDDDVDMPAHLTVLLDLITREPHPGGSPSPEGD